MDPWRDAPDLESAALVTTTAAAADLAQFAEASSGAVGSHDLGGRDERMRGNAQGDLECEDPGEEKANGSLPRLLGRPRAHSGDRGPPPASASGLCLGDESKEKEGSKGKEKEEEEQEKSREKEKAEKKKGGKEKGDSKAADARARAAQAAECGVVGVHSSTEVVQSEVGCLKLWRDRDHTLLLHKDCVCEMIKKNVSSVILMPQKRAGPGKEFPECVGDDIPVALRIPKDDTEVKEKKEKKEKKLKYPKYAFFKGRSNWKVEVGTTVVVEGVHLGWMLKHSGPMPSGCTHANDERGLPEPLEMLSVDDVRQAAGDPEDRDFVCVSLRQRRTAAWKIAHFFVRLVCELIAVHVFMIYIGTQPNTYTSVEGKPWDTESDGSFVTPGLFQLPVSWRGPGMERIWHMYTGSFFLFLGLKMFIAILWAVLPVGGKVMKFTRHFLAAVYPMAVSLPLVLYLAYFSGAVVACRQCSTWRCGAYASTSHHLQLDVEKFKAAGGCQINDIYDIREFRDYVRPVEKMLEEHEHCSFNDNRILDALGISLDTSQREGTCEPKVDTNRARDEVILKNLNTICGDKFTDSLNLEMRKHTIQREDLDTLPWTMFARHLPINSGGTCPKTGEGFENGPYVYYEPNARNDGKDFPQGAICVCRSAQGSRDCYQRLEGTAERCLHFTNVPEAYGGLLQFNSAPGLPASLTTFISICVPIFALFTIKAWDDIPLAGMDKFDSRLQSKMKLDVLDFYVFFSTSALLQKREEALPLVKMIFPDMTWHDFELNVWCIAWASAFIWWSVTIFCRAFDTDPDKTPKMWRSVQDIISNAHKSAEALERHSRFEDPYDTALRKQSVLYEKELQKVIKKRMVVDILAEGTDIYKARWRDWSRCIIIFSSPKVKELSPEDFEREDGTFTLYVAGAWPWSKSPPENVWKAESWEDFIAREPGCDGSEVPAGMRKVTLAFDEVLIRVRSASPYYWFDPRYLGWFYHCGCQPRSEYKKMKEEDHRIATRDRTPGYTETYYNKARFDYFERNIEMISVCRSLVVDLLFLIARLSRGIWGGGFGSGLKMLLVMKNLIFSLFGIVFICTCGNTKHACFKGRISASELLAKCIERTKIGNAIKLSMLMPLRICIESTSCCFRLSAESRQQYLTQRFHLMLLRRIRATSNLDTTGIDHEIRLLAGQIDEYQELIEKMDTRQIVRMRAKLRAKDMLG